MPFQKGVSVCCLVMTNPATTHPSARFMTAFPKSVPGIWTEMNRETSNWHPPPPTLWRAFYLHCLYASVMKWYSGEGMCLLLFRGWTSMKYEEHMLVLIWYLWLRVCVFVCCGSSLATANLWTFFSKMWLKRAVLSQPPLARISSSP